MGNSLARIRLGGLCLALVIAMLGCGGGGSGGSSTPPPQTYTASSGVAQKGPLIKGSTITAEELSGTLSPTGKQYTYQTTTDLGNFSPSSTFGSQYIGVLASGYYLDEVANAVSSGTITLNGYGDLAVDATLNVNLLTTLEYQRIQNLVTTSNMTFTTARTQAESEVLTALGIPVASYGSFDSFDLSGSTSGDQILAAVSSLFVYGNTSGTLSALIANFQSDIGKNGVITSAATKSALVAAAKGVNPTTVAANLTQAYSSVGVVFSAADISDWIDQDGDGVIGKFEFQVPDATPISVYTLPSFVVDQVAGTSVAVSAGQLSVNGTLESTVIVKSGDVVTLSPGPGAFPNGVLTVYVLSNGNKVAKVTFVSGLVSIAISPAAPSVVIGLTQQFTATATFSDTSTSVLTYGNVNWFSDTPGVAAIGASSGLAAAVAVGSTVITAQSGSVMATVTLTVTPAVVVSIAISPDPALSGVGLPLQLTATGSYSDGTTANLTTVAIWTSSAPTVATVGPTTGQTSGLGLGSATITAALGGVTASTPLSIVTNMWAATGSLTTEHEYHTATLLANGKVLVAGGENDYGAEATAELYDPIAGTWTTTGSLSTPRAGHTATLLTNGKVLVAGGVNIQVSGANLASAEIYDPATGTWSSTGTMSQGASAATATLLTSGKVLVAGGNQGNTTSVCQLFDPTTGVWSMTGSLSTARYSATATLLPNGNVLVTGGRNYGNQPTNVAELYDPDAGSWSSTASMSSPRSGHTATLLPTGVVLIAGGYVGNGVSVPGGATLATAEIYNPTAATWTSAGTLPMAVTDHTATLLPNGTVLVAGGNVDYDSPTATAGSALYDPSTGAWTSAASLTTARYGHTATLLPDGALLVAGGVTTYGQLPEIVQSPAAASELYW